ncbi:hypothetical protein AcW1_000122 [Taiwanofungus camphoratus]|nr:hypothetical protein AcW2_001386 [Antrodia cinnamomea]KAI0962884.1 hypothetical protein AcW1_000122 [Antrodia cinnamomea]
MLPGASPCRFALKLRAQVRLAIAPAHPSRLGASAQLAQAPALRAGGTDVRRSAQSPFPPSLISRSGAHMTPSPSLPAPSPDSHGPDRWKRAARGAMDLGALILDRQVPSSPRVPARLPPGRADTPAKWRLESGIRAARPPGARSFFRNRGEGLPFGRGIYSWLRSAS